MAKSTTSTVLAQCAWRTKRNEVSEPLPPPPPPPTAPPPPVLSSSNLPTQPVNQQCTPAAALLAATAIDTLVNDLHAAKLLLIQTIEDCRDAPLWRSYTQGKKRKAALKAFDKHCKRVKKKVPQYYAGAQVLAELETNGVFLVPTTAPPQSAASKPAVRLNAALTTTRKQSIKRKTMQKSSSSVAAPAVTVASTTLSGDCSVPTSTPTPSEIRQHSMLALSNAKQTMEHLHAASSADIGRCKRMLLSTSNPLSGTIDHNSRHTHTHMRIHRHTHTHTYTHTHAFSSIVFGTFQHRTSSPC